MDTYDLIVVGAGINGAAIAREVALSGRRVLLIERDDLGCGTSAASTRLIHGGLRYLEHGEIGLVRESLAERERLLQHASHLVRPLQLFLPLYRGSGRPTWQIRIGMHLYDLLSFDRSLPGHRILSRAAMLGRMPALSPDGLTGGATYFDAQVAYPERLVVELVLDAAGAGATVLTHAPVERLVIEQGRVVGVEYRAAGRLLHAAGTTVINAAGPWVDAVLGAHGGQRLIGGTSGAHLVVDAFPGAPADAVYAEARSDGRPFFVIPWNGLYLIGTTDERYDGDPAAITASESECRYLASEAAQLFSLSGSLAPYVRYAQAGIRPLPYTPSGSTGAITRRHIVHRHRDVDGLYSIIGGKLTTHRALAEDVARVLRRRIGLPSRSPTRDRPLPGAPGPDERDRVLARLVSSFDAAQAERLWQLYGTRAMRVLELAAADTALAMAVAPESRVIVAELLLALDEEFAVTLTDLLLRRTMAGLDADRGLGTAAGAANWLVRLGRWDSARAQAELAAYREGARRRLATGFDPA